MLHYYIMHDLVNNLDQKYKEQFTSFDRLFFSANYIKMMDFYNILSLKENPYNLREKFETESKQRELIDFFIKRAKEMNYDQSVILLAYGIIVNKAINEITKPYYDSLCGVGTDPRTMKKKQKLERIICYHLRDVFTVKNKEYKKIFETYTATESELDTITAAFTKVFQFSNTKTLLLKCQENLKFYYNQNVNFLYFKIRYYNFLDKRSKSKVGLRGCLRTKLFKKKYDYLNINNRKWLNPYTNLNESLSFFEIYQKIVDEVNLKADQLNELIFYTDKKHKKLMDPVKQEIVNKKLVNPIFKRRTIFKRKKPRK
ncbi:MAG: hypothetical protein R3Y60_04840 [bacterium]